MLALADDRTQTSANIPWIFRMPAQTSLAAATNHFIAAADPSESNRRRLRAALETR